MTPSRKISIQWNPQRWVVLFFTIWTGQNISWLGSAVAQFGLIWWVTETTGSAKVLAAASIASILPGVVLGPVIGALIDRWNRRVVMLVADGVIALASLWLAYLFWQGAMQMWQFYLVFFVRAVGGAFHFPANQASISLMIPREQLPRIGGINQTIGGAVNIISPPLGALALSVMPLHWIMMIDVITALTSILPLLFIIIPNPPVPEASPNLRSATQAILRETREGLGYIWSWGGMVGMLIIAALLNLFTTPAMSLVPILVTKHFQGGALQLGWLNASWGTGLLVGGVLLGVWGGFRKRTLTMLVGICFMGVGLLLVGAAPADNILLAVIGFSIGGIMNSITNGSAFALIQATVAPEVQGRMFTVVLSVAGVMNPLGLALGGLFADAYGVRPLYFIAGIGTLILCGVGFLSPRIMNLEDEADTVNETFRRRQGAAV